MLKKAARANEIKIEVQAPPLGVLNLTLSLFGLARCGLAGQPS